MKINDKKSEQPRKTNEEQQKDAHLSASEKEAAPQGDHQYPEMAFGFLPVHAQYF